MTDYAITFGQKYRHEEHPTHATGIDPDGYVLTVADDLRAATELAEATFGPYYAAVQPVADLPDGQFPEGKLFTVG